MRRSDQPSALPVLPPRSFAWRLISHIAVERATVLVGPALILTTLVLACGLVVTVFSDLPSLRMFGWLSAFSMVAALVADLFILRPTAMWLINLSERLRGGRTGNALG